MNGTIKKIKDRLGNYVFPITSTHAVYLDDGMTKVHDKLLDVDSKMNKNTQDISTNVNRINTIDEQLVDIVEQQGDVSTLNTADKSSVVNAIKEVKTQANTNQTGLSSANSNISTLQSQVVSLASGAPKAVSLVSEMTDTTKNYVYTGVESGYTAGNWYYWNGSAWTSGGVYQSTGTSDLGVGITKLSSNVTDKFMNFLNIKPMLKTGTLTTAGEVSTSGGSNTIRTDILFLPAGSTYTIGTGYKVILAVYFTLNGDKSITKSSHAWSSITTGTYRVTTDTVLRFAISKADETDFTGQTVAGVGYENDATIASIFTLKYPAKYLKNPNNTFKIDYNQSDFFMYGRSYGKYYALIGSTTGKIDSCYLSYPIYLHAGDVILSKDDVSNIKLFTYNDGFYEATNVTFTTDYMQVVPTGGYYSIALEPISTSIDLANIDIVIYSVNYVNAIRKSFGKCSEIVHHRGFSALRPENTLPSFLCSYSYGMKYVETDVNETSDGNFVIMHDTSVDRTTTGTGNIADLTLAQIKAFNIDAPFYTSVYNGTLKVPTLEEFLALVKSLGLYVFLEIKTVTNITNLYNIIKNYGMLDSVAFISFDYSKLVALRKLDDTIRLGYLSNTATSTDVGLVQKLGVNSGLDTNLSALTDSSIVEDLHQLGLWVGAWVTDSYDDVATLEDIGVDFITSNRIIKSQSLPFMACETIAYDVCDTSYSHTFADTDLTLFRGALDISVCVYFNSATQPKLVIGDKSYTFKKSGEWEVIHLQFVRRDYNSTETLVEFQDIDSSFRFANLNIKKYS